MKSKKRVYLIIGVIIIFLGGFSFYQVWAWNDKKVFLKNQKESQEIRAELFLNVWEDGAEITIKDRKTGEILDQVVSKQSSGENIIIPLTDSVHEIFIKKDGFLPLEIKNVSKKSDLAEEGIYNVSMTEKESANQVFQSDISNGKTFQGDKEEARKSYYEFLKGNIGCWEKTLKRDIWVSELGKVYLECEEEEIEKIRFMLFDFNNDGMEELFVHFSEKDTGMGYDLCISVRDEGSLYLQTKFETGARWENHYYKNGIFLSSGASGANVHDGTVMQYDKEGNSVFLYLFSAEWIEELKTMLEREVFLVEGKEYDRVIMYGEKEKGINSDGNDFFKQVCDERKEYTGEWNTIDEIKSSHTEKIFR